MNRMRRFYNSAAIGSIILFERRLPFLRYELIEQLQRYRLRSIVKHAYQTVPFYQRVMDERGLKPVDFKTVEDLKKLPLIDGEIAQKYKTELRSTRYPDHACQLYSTSGSQFSVRRHIHWENGAVLQKLARAERERIVLDRLLGKKSGRRQLLILPPVAQSIEIRSFWEKTTLLPTSKSQNHLSPDLPYEKAIERINEIQPEVVFSYGSYTEHFFRFLIDKKISIAAPRVWKYGSDMLSSECQDMIENQFGCKVLSAYGAVEAGIIGYQCEKLGGYHLNVDLCPIRIVDEDGQDVEPGQTGEVVISNLHNRATVLLNYRLDDVAALSTIPCTCGRSLPLLERLVGRNAGAITLPDGRKVSINAIRTLCLNELRSTLQAQLVQTAPRSILWRLVPYSGVDCQTMKTKILNKMHENLGSEFQISIEFVEKISSTPQGKFLNVVPYRKAPGESTS